MLSSEEGTVGSPQRNMCQTFNCCIFVSIKWG